MSSVISLVVFVLFALLGGSHMVSLSKASRPPTVWNLTWSANVSRYSPSSPFKVYLGDTLHIACPEDATSNIWIQEYLEQYEQCRCNVTGMENLTDCTPTITTRQVCQDEVLLAITADSNILKSALSFDSGRIYYLISYSTGEGALAGYGNNIWGGECLQGFRMVLEVVSTATTEPVTTTTTMPPKVVEGTTSSVGSRQTTVDLDQPGQVNEDNTPFVGEVGGLTNKAITTTITGLSSLALLMTSIVLALSCV